MQQHQVKTETDGSSIPGVQTKGTQAATELSALDRVNLSLNFIGRDPDGRYVFRYKDTPLKNLIGDRDDYLGWVAAHRKQAAIIDAEKQQVERLLAQGREYERTGDRDVFRRPVVIGS